MGTDAHYIDAFTNLVQDTENRTGLTLPYHLKAYTVMILAERMTDGLQPRKTYAESIMEMEGSTGAKLLGDSALWLTGVYPGVAQRNYKTEIGRMAYSRLTTERLYNRDLFVDLERYIYTVRDFITYAVHTPNL